MLGPVYYEVYSAGLMASDPLKFEWEPKKFRSPFSKKHNLNIPSSRGNGSAFFMFANGKNTVTLRHDDFITIPTSYDIAIETEIVYERNKNFGSCNYNVSLWCNISVMLLCAHDPTLFHLQPMEQGTWCNYLSFSIDNPNPVKAVAFALFSGIIDCFSAITPPKWVQTPQTKVKITPMELFTC